MEKEYFSETDFGDSEEDESFEEYRPLLKPEFKGLRPLPEYKWREKLIEKDNTITHLIENSVNSKLLSALIQLRNENYYMQRLSTDEGFVNYYFELSRMYANVTNSDIYELVEERYIELFNKRRCSTYDSFRHTLLSRYHKKR
ncbi:MAG: hypothetical protein PHQ65_09065 [Bacteroidales bacterium]|nr:hypothetical protein [Bacteroidales bacterium]MDD3665401.1 hypothetical protein [Bacteroidales bacterium]